MQHTNEENPLRSRVKIILDEAASPINKIPVSVHLVEFGVDRTMAVEMRLPTYFDGIVVSIIHEVLPPLLRPKITPNSLRNAARFGYQIAKSVEASICSPRVMRPPVFDIRIWEPNNMAHLLLDIIPYSLFVRRVAGPEVAILSRRLGERFAELLKIFGLVPVFERRRVEADVVKIRGKRGLAVYDFDLQHLFDCPGISFFPDVYLDFDFASSTRFDRIFLARRGARSLLNQTEVEEIVGKFGYRTVFMEDYSLSEQLSIGAQAKHVVAIHGAAMGFLAIGRRIESVVELLPANNYATVFPIALGPRVKRYDQIISNFDPLTQHVGWPTIARFKELPFALNTALLKKLLSNIH